MQNHGFWGLPEFLKDSKYFATKKALPVHLVNMKTTHKLLACIFIVATTFVSQRAQAQETWKFDPTFQRSPLRVTSESPTGVNVLSSGKVLIHSINGKLVSGANGQRIGALIRVDPDTGAIDPTWNPDPNITSYGFLGVAEAPDGKIYYSTESSAKWRAVAIPRSAEWFASIPMALAI